MQEWVLPFIKCIYIVSGFFAYAQKVQLKENVI